MELVPTIAAIFATTLFACGEPVAAGTPDTSPRRFVGGWDGANTRGSAALLLRDDLGGTLGEVILASDEQAYELQFAVSGELDSPSEQLMLELSCAEARTRSYPGATSNNNDQSGATDSKAKSEAMPTEPMDVPDDMADSWTPVDCDGWELELTCDLAGDCESNGCNMICDITYFGEAYARLSMPLAEVEDEFDAWVRV